MSAFQAEGTANAKALGHRPGLYWSGISKTTGRAMGGEAKGGGCSGQFLKGYVGCPKGLGSYSKQNWAGM